MKNFVIAMLSFAFGGALVYGLMYKPPVPPVDITTGLVPIEHHYEFRVDGASVFRFDTSTGETCMVQRSVRDRYNGVPYCLGTGQ